jgi:hypothetical protein
MKANIVLTCLLSILLSSCLSKFDSGSRVEKSTNTEKEVAGNSGKNNSGVSANPGENPFGTATTEVSLENGKAELIHLVDPVEGTFHKKVTIPKNYNGFFYLSGLNITALNDYHVSVRFKFGRELESITIPATVSRASGLTPQTDIQVLTLDLKDRPFSKLRLLYDLYDYNDYRDETGVEVDKPTNDPYDKGLYCRGLRLEHDSTFDASSTNTKCDETGERCLYAYAKVLDSGLYKQSDEEDDSSEFVAITPIHPQLDVYAKGYDQSSIETRELRCLPDSFNYTELSTSLSESITTMAVEMAVTLDDDEGNEENYFFNGPFRAIGEDTWEIKSASSGTSSALFFPTPAVGSDNYDNYPAGIFSYNGNSTSPYDPQTGFASFLFPRRGTMEISSEVEHLSSSSTWGEISKESLIISGETESMYGCNKRVSNYDKYSNEGIHNCNISATIEIIATVDGEEVLVDEATDLKVQIIRESETNYEGREVLYTSMKSCSSSNSCASDECCFNDRCWHNSLVSQCLEDGNVIGNLQTGENCNSDYQCSSLCCGESTSVCEVHLNNDQDQVLCGKTPSQSCVSREYCAQIDIVHCFVVKTGVDPLGDIECALRCYNIPTFGDCIDGSCQSPVQPTVPVFDPENPDCSFAMEAPSADALELATLGGSVEETTGDGAEVEAE